MKQLATTFLVMALSSCSIFYYGYEKVEWNALSDIEKAKVKASYQRAIAEKEKIVNGDHIESATEAFRKRAADKTDDRL